MLKLKPLTPMAKSTTRNAVFTVGALLVFSTVPGAALALSPLLFFFLLALLGLRMVASTHPCLQVWLRPFVHLHAWCLGKLPGWCGAIAGPFVGACAVELLQGRPVHAAVLLAFGLLLGVVALWLHQPGGARAAKQPIRWSWRTRRLVRLWSGGAACVTGASGVLAYGMAVLA